MVTMRRLVTFLSLLVLCLCAGPSMAQPTLKYNRTEDVIYGRKFGTALTMDVFEPGNANGVGLIFVVSGGWFSAHEVIGARLNMLEPLMARGYTIFAVVHGSQPKFDITEISQDMDRSVRFIRHNASKYGIDPNRLGVFGGSAGGHLSLTLAVHGAKGNPKAKDPVDKESSEVQCIACWYPPTDFLNYGSPGEIAVGVGTLKKYQPAFGPRSTTEEGRLALGREISPIYFITPQMPPVLIIHGDADKLVPMQQSESFVKKAQAEGATARLVVRPGKQHGWPDIEPDIKMFGDWFDEHLRGATK